MNYKIGTRVCVIHTDSKITLNIYGVISGIKPYSEGLRYYVVDDWYYDYEITLPSNEELGTFY